MTEGLHQGIVLMLMASLLGLLLVTDAGLLLDLVAHQVHDRAAEPVVRPAELVLVGELHGRLRRGQDALQLADLLLDDLGLAAPEVVDEHLHASVHVVAHRVLALHLDESAQVHGRDLLRQVVVLLARPLELLTESGDGLVGGRQAVHEPGALLDLADHLLHVRLLDPFPWLSCTTQSETNIQLPNPTFLGSPPTSPATDP